MVAAMFSLLLYRHHTPFRRALRIRWQSHVDSWAAWRETDRMGTTAIDVILRTHNRAGLLADAVGSLMAADRTGIALRLVVVDNRSSDGTPSLLARLAETYGDLLV